MSSPLNFFAAASRGVEPLLAAELAALGAAQVRETAGGVYFSGDLVAGYRACLWSRLASRVLLPLSSFPLVDADSLHAAAKAVDWTQVFAPERTFAIEVAGRSPAVTHTHFAGLRVKDGIADCFREKIGRRPDVDTENPDIRVHLHIHADKATLSLDLSGDSLHRRGYREDGAAAPLKENLAAAILVRAGWPATAAAGGALLDPMCGSGTLVIEAALMAGDIAPALLRPRFGFEAWLGHDAALWTGLRAEAQRRREHGIARIPPLVGQDIDERALRAARANARRAGLEAQVRFAAADISQARPVGTIPGLVVANPPYGERLGAEAEVIKLHSLLGAALREHFAGWRAAVFTGRPDLGERLGLRAEKLYSLYNGPLLCKLLVFDVPQERADAPTAAEGGFANRLRKNLKHLSKWARRSEVSCYRLYDADLKDYAVAVDVYEAEELHVHVQEYAAPKTVDPVRAEKRLREALSAIASILEVPASRIHYRLRKPQRGTAQYEKHDEAGRMHPIREHGCNLLVNFDDYLDTGLFLDHRPLRRRIQQEAGGKRFLNLFCYTGSATAHAVRGGATGTLSVDLSNTYLEWARRNLSANGVDATVFERQPSRLATHSLLRADCLRWLQEQAASPSAPKFDLILLDPPTFSNSKRMEDVLDVQHDHVQLIRDCGALLAAGGTIYFSTNRRGFKLDEAALAGFAIKDITAQTLDEDFRRPPPAHRCWQFTRA